MLIGTAWYPEYIDETHWDADLAQIRAAGIGMVRFGEFAWSRIEPGPGRYDTDWIARAIDACRRHGILVVIGTPTAAPPIWMAERHPETLPVDDSGRRTGFGARQQRCYNAPAYRKGSHRVVEHLAARFGSDPAVIAWQIDNELGGEQKACYCDLCRDAFHAYLATRYDGIDDLNRRWGTQFWSHTYARFDQIPVPRRTAMQLGLKHHPSLMLEWMRFSSASLTSFCQDQAAILRRLAPGRTVTTNYDAFDWGENVDLRRLFAGLDVVGFDLYSDNPDVIAFYCDFMHDVLGKPFWFMEYAVNSPRLAAELDLIAGSGGVDRLFFFKYRPFPWGQEQDTRALRTITGGETPNYKVIRDWTGSKTTSQPLQPNPGPPTRRVGIVYDFDSSWSRFLTGWSGIPGDLTYPRGIIDPVHKSVTSLGERARFVLRPDDIRDLDLLVLPWTVIHDPALEQAVLDHLARGGSLLMTADIFLKNRDNVFNESLPRLYREGLGLVGEFLDHDPVLDHGLVRDLRGDGRRVVVLSPKATRDDWTRWLRILLAK